MSIWWSIYGILGVMFAVMLFTLADEDTPRSTRWLVPIVVCPLWLPVFAVALVAIGVDRLTKDSSTKESSDYLPSDYRPRPDEEVQRIMALIQSSGAPMVWVAPERAGVLTPEALERFRRQLEIRQPRRMEPLHPQMYRYAQDLLGKYDEPLTEADIYRAAQIEIERERDAAADQG